MGSSVTHCIHVCISAAQNIQVQPINILRTSLIILYAYGYNFLSDKSARNVESLQNMFGEIKSFTFQSSVAEWYK